LETAALTIEARARRVHDALSALAGATRMLRAMPADDTEIARWVEQGGFVADATGFYERASLLERVRAGADVRDEASWFWPSTRKDDPVARRRLHPLRAVGPWLHAIHQQLPDAQWIY